MAGRRQQSDVDSGGNDWLEYAEPDSSPDGFALCSDLLLTKDGAPRKRLATKKLADARPDLLDFLPGCRSAFAPAAKSAGAPPAPRNWCMPPLS